VTQPVGGDRARDLRKAGTNDEVKVLMIDGQALLRDLHGEFFELLRHEADERRAVQAGWR
jgi:hypothetical protein